MKYLLISLSVLASGALLGCQNEDAQEPVDATETQVETELDSSTEPATDAVDPVDSAEEEVVEEEPATSLPESNRP